MNPIDEFAEVFGNKKHWKNPELILISTNEVNGPKTALAVKEGKIATTFPSFSGHHWKFTTNKTGTGYANTKYHYHS